MKKYLLLLIIPAIAIVFSGIQADDKITTKEYMVGGERVIINEQSDLLGASTFKPEVKLQKWGDETWIKVLLDEEGDDFATQEGNKTVWHNKDKSKEVNMYPLEATTTMENGGFEYEVILKKKPKINVISLKIESQGLDFFYQPVLTQKEINDGFFRPENVVGSYAVYHSTKSGDYSQMGGKNYMAGKAFQMPRPQMEDANGWKVWGEFNKDLQTTKNLSITIPQYFLDNAVYPIKHATGLTFGYTSIGGSGITIGQDSNTSQIVGNTFNLGVNGTLDSLHVALSMDDGTRTADTFVALYREDSAGSGSHDLVVGIERANLSITITPTFYTFTAASEELTSDDYILAALVNGEDIGPLGTRCNIALDSLVSRNRYNEQTSASGSYATRKGEDPWTETATAGARDYSIYATYTAASADSTDLIGIKGGTLNLKGGTLQIK